MMLFHMHENSRGIRALAVRSAIPSCRKLHKEASISLNINLDLSLSVSLSVSPRFWYQTFPLEAQILFERGAADNQGCKRRINL